MADNEIKVHRRVIRIFPMIQSAKNDRSVQRALPVYDNDFLLVFEFLLILYRIAWWTIAEKELISWLIALCRLNCLCSLKSDISLPITNFK